MVEHRCLSALFHALAEECAQTTKAERPGQLCYKFPAIAFALLLRVLSHHCESFKRKLWQLSAISVSGVYVYVL